MNQRQLSQAITEGMNQHTNDIWHDAFEGLLWGVGITAIAIIIYAVWNEDSSNLQQQMVQKQVCNYPILDCNIIDTDKTLYTCNGGQKYVQLEVNNTNIKNISIEKGNCIPSEKIIARARICGYQEANAWFEQLNYNFVSSLKMECK